MELPRWSLVLPFLMAARLLAPARGDQLGFSSSQWGQVMGSVLALEGSYEQRAWVAAFDVDGTLIREKPNLLEVDWAKDALCSRSPPSHEVPTRLAGLCNGTKSLHQLAYPREVYELLLLPFARWPVDRYHAAAVSWLRSRRSIVYAAMADFIGMLIKRGWRVMLVSQTMVDTIRALAAAYQLDVHAVLGTVPEVNLDAGRSPVLRRGMRLHGPLMNGKEKVQAIWAHEGRLPLVAVGNSAGDLVMLRSAVLGIVLDHNSSAECADCNYPQWSSRDDLRHNVSTYGWHVVSVDDLPRPLFRQPEGERTAVLIE